MQLILCTDPQNCVVEVHYPNQTHKLKIPQQLLLFSDWLVNPILVYNGSVAMKP